VALAWVTLVKKSVDGWGAAAEASEWHGHAMVHGSLCLCSLDTSFGLQFWNVSKILEPCFDIVGCFI